MFHSTSYLRQVFLAILSRFVLLCGLTLYLLMVFRVCFHSIKQILSHILVGMKIVCQHSCKQRKVLLHISRKLGGLPIIGNIDRMHQLFVNLALHDFTSKFQHGNHITKMFQHLQLQVVRANYLASDLLRNLIQFTGEFGILIFDTDLFLTMRFQFLLIQLQIYLIAFIFSYKWEAYRIPFSEVTIVVFVGHTKGDPVDEEERFGRLLRLRFHIASLLRLQGGGDVINQRGIDIDVLKMVVHFHAQRLHLLKQTFSLLLQWTNSLIRIQSIKRRLQVRSQQFFSITQEHIRLRDYHIIERFADYQQSSHISLDVSGIMLHAHLEN